MSRVFAFSDLHGEYKLWKQIQNELRPDDRAYFLGDAADRGKDGMKIMTDILCDPRIVYILGNHEDMMRHEIKHGTPDSFSDWLLNGGAPTKEAFIALPHDVQDAVLGCLNTLPREAVYTNKKGQRIFMCHAGTNPDEDESDWLRRTRLKDAYLWNREHFWDEWPDDERYKNTYIIHGHTYSDYVAHCVKIKPESEYKVLKYADGHKIDIDLCSAFSGVAALLDLDTLEPKYFYEEVPKNEN